MCFIGPHSTIQSYCGTKLMKETKLHGEIHQAATSH